jgi:hypothetical protein
MLNITDYSTVKSLPREITGRNIAHKPRSAGQRAIIGAELLEGTAILIKPTLLQVSELVSVCAPYIRAAKVATPAERRLIASGAHKLYLPKIIELPSVITDADLDRIARTDADRLWRALERAEAESRGHEEKSIPIY